MPFYSREVCESVRNANDIVDVIGSYVKLERRSSRYFGLCPFHNEKTGSFCVSGDNQMYHCFGCHESGNVVSFLMKYENMEFTEAIEMLAERAGMNIVSETPTGDSGEYRKKRDELLLANKKAAEYYYRKLRSPEGERGMKYFTDRGLSPKILNSFGLGYTGTGSNELYAHLKEAGFSDELLIEAGLVVFDEKRGARDRFFNRVMFPIMDPNRHVIAFGARVMGDGQPKYLNSAESPIFNKSKTLYGLFAARRSKSREFILCEGYMDVISSHMAGFDNAVATLGTALTEDHARELQKFKRPVLLCYDTDGAGRNAAKRGFEILRRAEIPTKIMDLSPYKDPDEFIKALGTEAFNDRIKNAKNAFITIMQWEYEDVDKQDPDAQTGFVHLLAKRITECFSDAAGRENYIKACAPLFSVSPDILRRMVNGEGQKSALTSDRTPDSPALMERRKRRGIDREGALRQAEATLLYFLSEQDFFDKTKGLIEREDFSFDVFRQIYDDIVENMNQNTPKSPSDLVDVISDEEVRNFLFRVFFETKEVEVSALPKLKKNTLLRVKKAGIKRNNSGISPGDVKRLQEAMEFAKETIEDIEKLSFT